MDKKPTPPPREIMNELPDYYLGCLIYYDDCQDNTMNWICYDGREKMRCISRASAEQYARSIRLKTTEEEIGHLMSAHHFLTRSWKAIDKAAAKSDVETRLWLELKAVEARKMADAIDLLISQKMPLKDEK